MRVAVSELRASLRAYLDRVRGGEELVVTERGVPVARLIPAQGETLLERLEREGLVSPPRSSERTRARDLPRVIPRGGSVSDLISEMRD